MPSISSEIYTLRKAGRRRQAKDQTVAGQAWAWPESLAVDSTQGAIRIRWRFLSLKTPVMFLFVQQSKT